MIEAQDNTVVVQALVGGTMPADVPGVVKKGDVEGIAHAYIVRFNTDGKISRLDCYWDNTVHQRDQGRAPLALRPLRTI